ncbi:GNAT family N-acetyltransferase [Pseudomonas aeruginosa]|uniref:GNAT family N-acetyltransferase n=1 Tax=Pseudomonas aeruginosa TaxID=287 RepID=UPI0008FB9516|nr:GNAT family N-acetyltransferase [Pseudomonas aeruginosa]EIU7089663.1 GNAT family N-acetyltransferase [Pseudomonas aeruginosa]EMC2594053.1 GNAT family N-acetyltransferase [Pseudomonas aeruginosa]EMC2594505.1 GNAT family N-acetyltransferase [Pseudomonas aeruginosa]MBA4945840.1 GNAT family N-acetyltransferase [Pseudomonas aeruginosa]MBG5269663.1 GNAT family N-acetyltransferase [Pseudomonas aeruginosa]
MYKVLKIDSIDALKSPVLYERAKRAHGGRSQEFVMIASGHEAGLLSYEDWRQQSDGFIYEIFVLPEFRQQGIGAMLLSYAENYALQLRCARIRLKPYPLDQETDPERLVAWYTKNGYFQIPDEPEILEKSLATIQA